MTKRELLEAAQRGEGPLGQSADTEPVFCIRGSDVYAAQVVRRWAGLTERVQGSSPQTEEAWTLANVMDRWRHEHGGGDGQRLIEEA